MTDKVFLLGVGVQKAGTSWLHAWLETSARFSSGLRKEYHVWDALTVPQASRLLREDGADLAPRFRVFHRNGPFHGKSMVELAALALWKGRIHPARPNVLAMWDEFRENPHRIRSRMLASTDAYFDYFAGVLARPGIDVTADITPSYSALSPQTLGRIKDGFRARGIKVRVILLLRDPVDRCFSHARMKTSRKRAKGLEWADPSDWLAAHMGDDILRMRTDYPAIVGNLRQVFAPDDIHIALYESLFGEAEMKRVAGFAGLDLDPHFATERRRVGMAADLQPAVARKVAQQFRAVYDWAEQEVPESRHLWPGFAMLD